MLNTTAVRLAELAIKHRMPNMHGVTAYADSAGLAAYWPNRKAMHRRAAETLSTLHVRVKSTYQEIGELSGGQRQAVAIARAVSFDPAVLILDEPTAALAVAEVRQVLKIITNVASRGVGVILITHRLQDLFEVCDRISVMYEGRSVEDEPISRLDVETLVAMITRSNVEEGAA